MSRLNDDVRRPPRPAGCSGYRRGGPWRSDSPVPAPRDSAAESRTTARKAEDLPAKDPVRFVCGITWLLARGQSRERLLEGQRCGSNALRSRHLDFVGATRRSEPTLRVHRGGISTAVPRCVQSLTRHPGTSVAAEEEPWQRARLPPEAWSGVALVLARSRVKNQLERNSAGDVTGPERLAQEEVVCSLHLIRH